ncbi:MAG: glycosyltransferase family 2 protein [Abditibacteriales bacterium]|nr:glycosyltransferase family 2 protein [Abditibacteriales bacterium]MDW8367826.1 glycosyltransferase family 2 protein [Abditibacteriales bacterium]
MAYSLSLFLPCFNEEPNVERTVRASVAALREVTDDFEVIVVNDGSRDHTGEIAERLAAENSHVRVCHHEQNRGYGAALRTGFLAAQKELVCFMDADGQFDPREIRGLLSLADQADIVTGFRLNRRDPFIRSVNAFLFNRLVRLLFGLKVMDLNCAFKLYHRRVVDAIAPQLESTGAFINAEMLIRARKAGFSIVEVGVHHYPRVAGTQTGANPRVILRAFRELGVLFWKLR